MAETLWPGLRTAIDELDTIRRRIDDIVDDEVDPGRSMVRFLRGIPADDNRKKRELAKFFQTSQGQRYNSFAKRLLYDELLGRERNEENRG